MTARILSRTLAALAGMLLAATASAQSVVATLPVGDLARAVVVNPVTNKTYVASQNAGTVTVIQNATLAKTTVPAAAAWGLAVNPSTNRIYASSSSGAVYVIDGASDTVVATVPMGPLVYSIAVNAVTNRVYATNYLDKTVTVINGADNSTVAINVGTNPAAVAVNPVTNRVYVANAASNNVSVIDGASGTVVATVVAGTAPNAVAVNPATNMVYVTNFGSSEVTAIDGATNVPTSISVGTNPNAIAVNPAFNRIYVANAGSNYVSVIDGATGAVIATPPVGSEPIALSVNALTNRIFVANRSGDSVSVLNGLTYAATTLPLGAGSTPQSVVVNPVTNRAYVANSGASAGTSTVTVIDGAMNVTETFPVTGLAPSKVAVDAIIDRVYVASENSALLSELNGSTGVIVRTIPVGTKPSAIALNPQTNRIYVANHDSNDVTIADAGVTTATVAVGTGPVAIAVNQVTDRIYVVNGLNAVTVIEGATNIATTIPTPFVTTLSAIALNLVTNRVYVPLNVGSVVMVIDGLTHAVSTIDVGAFPEVVAVNARTNRIYVGRTSRDSVTVIDGTNLHTTPIATGTTPVAIAVNEETNRIYVANQGSNNVTVIDGATNATVTVPAGTAPSAIAINPLTNTVYVTNAGSNNVTVIDGATNTARTVAAGTNPAALAVNPVTNRVYVANRDSNDVTLVRASPHTFAPRTPNVGTGSYNTDNDYALAIPAYPNLGANDVPVRTVYSRLGDANGPHAASAGTGPYIATVSGLQPGLNYVSLFAMDAMEGTSISSSSGGAGAGPTWTGLNRVFAIVQSPPYVTTPSLPAATLGVAYNAAVAGKGPSMPLTFSVTQGALPPGLALNGTSGAITGTPTAGGTFGFVVSATDGFGGTGSRAFSITVGFPPGTTFPLTINMSGAGKGAVSASPGAITCMATCSTNVAAGATLTLSASADTGSNFAGWSGGGCSGTGACTVTMNAATNITATFNALPVANPPRLGNISTRGQVLTGNDVMIGGFVIGGSTNKTVVVRARGPSLVPFGIANALANPSLQLVRSSDQAPLASNDDWGSASNAAAVTSSGFAPSNTLESAILVTLPPGAYTAIVSGVGGGTGVGIIEVFEVDQPATPLINISTRGKVLTGNDVMIGGFVIQGSGPQTVVVRARGPSLVPFGITNALANPALQLVRSSDQATLATNDDWGSASNAAAVTASGFAPSNGLEAAILITLDPGAYTAIVTGAGGGTGVGIVEVFAAP